MSNQYVGSTSNTGILEKIVEGTRMARAESMDVGNDPRYFQDNVINYRLLAFGSLSVVSGLLVGNAMSGIFDMSKSMGLVFPIQSHMDAILQLISFTFMCLCFFFNLLATYVGVAQPYHIMRLMTSGATGFEAATAYYLNPNIVIWRHSAIRAMLNSLPLFCMQMGLRLVTKFDRGTMDDKPLGAHPPWHARIEGWTFCVMFLVFSGMLWSIHLKHFAVFRDRYSAMITPAAMSTHMNTMMQPRVNQAKDGKGGWFGLDV